MREIEQEAAGDVPPKKILAIVHRRESNPGAIGQWLRANGYTLDIRCHRLSDDLPPTLAGYAGAMIFGGPMSANDADDFVRTEIDWIGVPLRENKPFFGICLGAQMLAKHLGAEVRSHPGQFVEAGYYPIAPSEDGASLMRWPDQVYQWHMEGFSLPAGATRLASGSEFENQAIQYGERAYGVQFHPEMTLAMIHRWTTVAAHRLVSPGARPRSEHIAAHYLHGARQRAWLDRFMRLWLGCSQPSETLGDHTRASHLDCPDKRKCFKGEPNLVGDLSAHFRHAEKGSV